MNERITVSSKIDSSGMLLIIFKKLLFTLQLEFHYISEFVLVLLKSQQEMSITLAFQKLQIEERIRCTIQLSEILRNRKVCQDKLTSYERLPVSKYYTLKTSLLRTLNKQKREISIEYEPRSTRNVKQCKTPPKFMLFT